MMNRVMHFELSAADPERAARFYEYAFGWKIEKWNGPAEYWTIITGEGAVGINGGLQRAGEQGVRTVNTIEVASIEMALNKIQVAGGRVVTPKTAIPGVGYQAYCADPDGIIFGIFVDDPSAK